ncbi:MAG TPA: hypothetical protein DHW82_00445 [Spirochaetia bacterium]|nr:MAG: hypothetical protein A2Y41_07190 [Spirochaetes bacterium GWB1_36_13]HCL55468.1 hypothetical protein [Spirochaetia bacterium]
MNQVEEIKKQNLESINWAQYEKFCYKVAHAVAKKYQVPFCELQGYAWEGFEECREKYNPEKNPHFIGFLKMKLNYYLIDKLRQEKRPGTRARGKTKNKESAVRKDSIYFSAMEDTLTVEVDYLENYLARKKAERIEEPTLFDMKLYCGAGA